MALQPGDSFNPWDRFVGIFVPSGIASCEELSQGEKLAYGALLRFAGRNGVCFPSMRALGRRLGVTARQARAYMASLEAKELIRRTKRFNGRTQKSNGFEFLWNELLIASMKKKSSAGPLKTPSGLPRNDSSAKENQNEESHSEESKNDLDYMPLNGKSGDSSSGTTSGSACKRYPLVQEVSDGSCNCQVKSCNFRLRALLSM